jgi:hypothetical protein
MTNLMTHALILRKRTNNEYNYVSKTFKFHFQTRIAKGTIRIKTRFICSFVKENSQGHNIENAF